MTPRAPHGGLEEVRGSVWLLAGALILVALLLVLLLRPLLAPPRDVAAAPPPAVAHGGDDRRRPASAPAAPEATDRRPAQPRSRRPGEPPAPPAAGAGSAVDAPAAADGDAADGGDDGAPSGIALFPPPGTDPPRPGIIVPEGFELPPGYVRHHQVTDDGTPLPPILMFHPDYEWVDAQGRPIALPADGVVPPELAPPGMPVEMLAVPDTRIEAVEPPPGDDRP